MTVFSKKKSKKVAKTKSQIIKEEMITLLFITIGAMIAAFSLECFLLPNDIIDGGIIGLSMMISHITKWNLGLIVIALNIPFIYLALQKMGNLFVLNVFYGVSVLAVFLNLFSGYHVTEVPMLATVFGGIILGLGVGLILRNDGALDGTEILAIRMAKKFGFSVGEIIMFFNVFIYTAAGTLYGWDSAMYSILTYFIVYRVIDIVLEGLNSAKAAWIISNNPEEIGNSIIKTLDISVTYLRAKGGYSKQEKIIVYCIISRLEVTKMKKLIREVDPEAFLVIQGVHEVEGVRVKKK